MKRYLLAACATCACTPAAMADSTVTLSGVLDAAVRQVSNEGVGSAKSVVSGSNATSRLVFSGKEDLGNGLSAGFHLEHGLLADTGAQTTAEKFWDRRATVALASDALGEARLGRDYVPTYSVWTRYDPFSYVGVARTANLVSATPTGPIRSAFGSNANTTVRSDNAVQYLLPAGLGGVEGGLMVAAGEGGDATAGKAKVLAVRLGYASKAFGISGATASSENSLTTAGRFNDTVIGGHVEFANVKVSAARRQFKYDDSKQSLSLIGAVASWGPHEVKASWARSEMAGTVAGASLDGNDATQWGLGYVYNLSKRSALYATVATVSNDGASRYVITEGPAGMAAGGTSRGYEAGIRHRF